MTKNNNLRPVEKLCKETKTPGYVFEGVKVFKGWATGKEVTEKDFCTAVKEFLAEPAGGITAVSHRKTLRDKSKEPADKPDIKD